MVRRLLDKGYRVRACVRDANNAARTDFLKAMPGYASGRLTLHSADLDNPGSFDDIFAGCHGIAHVAHVSDYSDHEYVRMVCDHLIESVNKARTVSRVVVTSSIAAVISEADMNEFVRRPVLYEDRYPDEHNPKRTPDRQGYSMAKIIAQRAFSDAAEQSGDWDAVTCCPADNVGPIQSAHQKNMGPWQHNIEMMLLGEYFQNGAYRPWMTVDVRDDADCHIGLLESVHVNQRRAVHRLVDGHPEGRGHLRRHRPRAAGVGPRHARGDRQLPGPHQGAGGEVPRHLGWLRVAQ